jgi:integrase
VRAGLAERGYTGHSLRRGFITAAVDAGADRAHVAAVSGHRPGSPVIDEYYEQHDRWAQNPLTGILTRR